MDEDREVNKIVQREIQVWWWNHTEVIVGSLKELGKVIHRERQERLPIGDGSWTVCKRQEMEQKEGQGRDRLLFSWCTPQAAILHFKILKYFFTSWQSAIVPCPIHFPQPCHPIFAPERTHDPKPKGLRFGISGGHSRTSHCGRAGLS